MSADPASDAPLKRTPLYAEHVALGAKMVPFAGYEMPVQYPLGILKEHLATRAQAGLFDVSHMGQAMLTGPDHASTAAALEALVPADIVNLAHRPPALHPAPHRCGRHHRRPDGDAARRPRQRRPPDARRQRLAQGRRLRAHRQPPSGEREASARARARAARRAGSRRRAHCRCALPRGAAARLHAGGQRPRWRLRLSRLALGLHRRGRLRDLGCRRRRGRPVAAAVDRTMRRAHRPRRARLAAAGSRPVPLRPRHRRDHQPHRGGPRAGRSRSGAASRAASPAPGASRTSSPTAPSAAASASGPRAARPRARAPRSSRRRASASASSPPAASARA